MIFCASLTRKHGCHHCTLNTYYETIRVQLPLQRNRTYARVIDDLIGYPETGMRIELKAATEMGNIVPQPLWQCPGLCSVSARI